MGQVYSFANSSPDLAESVNIGQPEVLERAVGKLVSLGRQAGVSTDQMIHILESGLSVAELLEYLVTRNRHVFEILGNETRAWAVLSQGSGQLAAGQ